MDELGSVLSASVFASDFKLSPNVGGAGGVARPDEIDLSFGISFESEAASAVARICGAIEAAASSAAASVGVASVTGESSFLTDAAGVSEVMGNNWPRSRLAKSGPAMMLSPSGGVSATADCVGWGNEATMVTDMEFP